MSFTNRRITIFAGHYGSGKTTIALNYAFFLKNENNKTAICDLDIVNPYFRTVDSADLLKQNGIELISSKFAGSNLDVPSVSPDTQKIFDNKDLTAVVDLGGDDRGALALGRFAEAIKSENNYEMLMVINKYRPLTRDAQSVIEIKDEIENASKIKFTGIVNNSNLGNETTLENIHDSIEYAEEISQKISLPILMTAIREDLFKENISINNLFKINIFPKNIWKI